MLFEPDRHEPLNDTPWDPAQARDAIAAIIRDTEQAMLPDGRWPPHPLDDDPDEPTPATGFKSLYFGSAGVLWALWYLERAGCATPRSAPHELVATLDAAYRAAPDSGEVVPSYFLGEVGILLVQWRMTGARDVADRLWSAIRANLSNPSHEAFLGTSGTMVGALHMAGWTGEPRWHALVLEHVEPLWQTWLPGEHGDLWTQQLADKPQQLLGAAHGFAGNVYPLLRGAALLDPERRDEVHARCVATLLATARFEDDRINWPASVPDGRLLVQWCHGAPGIVTALAELPRSPDADRLLLGAGETVWAAGPLRKGHGLCHGTAGNGYAFLKLHRRTSDERWLRRARAFAMHAIGQWEHARGRYSLWTGDPGLAIYLWHCLTQQHELPGLDVL